MDASLFDEYESSATAAAETYDPRRVEAAAGGGPAKGRGGGAGAGAAAGTIEVKLNPDVNIGLNLDALDGVSVFVDALLPGAVMEWNRGCAEEDRLRVYDRIVAVNGAGGDTDRLLGELRARSTWRLTVLRPVEMRVVVDCTRIPSLGLDLKYSPNGTTLLIQNLGEGAVRDWNAGPQAQKVCKFDRIAGINGVRGSARSLLEAAASVEVLDLVILHYEEHPPI